MPEHVAMPGMETLAQDFETARNELEREFAVDAVKQLAAFGVALAKAAVVATEDEKNTYIVPMITHVVDLGNIINDFAQAFQERVDQKA